MAIRVTRSARGQVVIYVQRRGEKLRPQKYRPGGSGSGGGKKGAKSGGSSGTRGDFGADFE